MKSYRSGDHPPKKPTNIIFHVVLPSQQFCPVEVPQEYEQDYVDMEKKFKADGYKGVPQLVFRKWITDKLQGIEVSPEQLTKWSVPVKHQRG